jgi:hypothetical protein
VGADVDVDLTGLGVSLGGVAIVWGISSERPKLVISGCTDSGVPALGVHGAGVVLARGSTGVKQ